MKPATPRPGDVAGREAPVPGADAEADRREARLREQIDRNLQRVYRETLEEPVPARFLDLIAELRDKLKKP
jgi:hypothetical protein